MNTNTRFYSNYNKKINEIIRLKDTISGTHELDLDKVHKWISSQLTERRRNAAMHLVNNTFYIKFNEVFEYIKGCVIEIYKNINVNDNIYIYVKDHTSSFHFFGIIALYFIKQLGYKEPIAIDTLYPNIQIMIFDDCSYSGIQMHQLLFGTGYNFNIFFGVCCMTQSAYDVISGTGIMFQSQIRVWCGAVVPLLIDKVGSEIYNDIMYYFSPYTQGLTKVSLYFDHKIAEPISTFLKVLNFGPILPKNLNYDYNLLRQSLVFDNIFFGIMTEHEFNKYYAEMINEENSIVSQNDEANKLNFIPFIKNCECNVEKLENISYSLLQISYLNYNENMENYDDVIDVIDIVNCNENRSIKSFYKTIFDDDNMYTEWQRTENLFNFFQIKDH